MYAVVATPAESASCFLCYGHHLDMTVHLTGSDTLTYLITSSTIQLGIAVETMYHTFKGASKSETSENF